MTDFTDSAYKKMMVQKPQYAPAKDRPPKKEQKIRKLIVMHENKGAKSKK